MQQKTSKLLFAYWNEVRGSEMAPQRFDIEPARIAYILPETFILECVGSDTFRYRLAGTRICEQFGHELRGANFLDGWADDDVITLERQLAALVRQGAGLLLAFDAAPAQGPPVRFEALLLPLLHTRNVVARILGSISAVPPHPGWLGAERPVRRRLIAHDLLWPDGRPHSVVHALGRQSPFLPEMSRARIVTSERRRFRVFDGGLGKQPKGR